MEVHYMYRRLHGGDEHEAKGGGGARGARARGYPSAACEAGQSQAATRAVPAPRLPVRWAVEAAATAAVTLVLELYDSYVARRVVDSVKTRGAGSICAFFRRTFARTTSTQVHLDVAVLDRGVCTVRAVHAAGKAAWRR